jgi:hypothetical protein
MNRKRGVGGRLGDCQLSLALLSTLPNPFDYSGF